MLIQLDARIVTDFRCVVARHASERYSSMKVFILLAFILEWVGIPFASTTTSLLYDLPNSRKMESEGPYLAYSQTGFTG